MTEPDTVEIDAAALGAAVRLPGGVRAFPGIAPDKGTALKPLEEAAEAFAAWQAWERYANTGMATAWEGALLAEVADCIQALCNLAASVGCRDLSPHMEACERRNEERGRYE